MARLRTIKPSFFTNEELVSLPMAARLLFAGLWTIADRRGRLEDRPLKIKLQLFPGDDVDTDALLADLHEKRLIQRYEVGGAKLIQVINFERHQAPHIKEAESTIPAPDGHCASTVQAPESTVPAPPVNFNRLLSSVNRELEPSSEGDAPAGASPPAPPKRPPRKTELTDEFTETMVGEYAPLLGGELRTRQIVSEALAHKNRNKWDDKQAYLKGWLRRESEQYSEHHNGRTNGHGQHRGDPEDATPSPFAKFTPAAADAERERRAHSGVPG